MSELDPNDEWPTDWSLDDEAGPASTIGSAKSADLVAAALHTGCHGAAKGIALGTLGQSVRGAFHIAASPDIAGAVQNDGAHLEIAVGRIGILAGLFCQRAEFIDQLSDVCHALYNPSSAVSTTSMTGPKACCLCWALACTPVGITSLTERMVRARLPCCRASA